LDFFAIFNLPNRITKQHGTRRSRLS
jgi:hypothetical protein